MRDVVQKAGFEALYFGRIDYQDSEKRIAESDMEMVWRASRSFEEGAQIFTGEFRSEGAVSQVCVAFVESGWPGTSKVSIHSSAFLHKSKFMLHTSDEGCI